MIMRDTALSDIAAVCAGISSLIMFDPERKSGVVALWNSNVSRPTGIQFEVMDMIYGLEKRDWMRLMPDTPAQG